MTQKYPRIMHRMKATRVILLAYTAAATIAIGGLWLVWWLHR